MKNYISITLFIVVALFFASCNEYLDRYPMDQISPGSFWKTEADLQIGLNNLYQYLNSRSWNEDIQSADFYPNGGNIISQGTLSSSDNNSEKIWNLCYQQLRAVHEFLDNYDRANEPDDVKERYVGEALFFRAYFHFQLVRHFGDVPIVSSLLSVKDPEVYGVREPRGKVVDQMIEDLKQAAAYLPAQSWIESNRPSEDGRLTQGAALALLSRIGLYEGTFEKYHGAGNPNKYLEACISAANELMTSGEYNLSSNFSSLFLTEGDEEVILAYQYSKAIDIPSPRPSRTVEVGGFTPTKRLADSFLCSDGLPIEKSSLFQGYSSLTSEFENRDPRMEMTIWRPGSDNHPRRGSNFNEPVLTISSTGYYAKKGADYSAYQTDVYTDEILFRYAEVLLNYAEASFELNGNISDADLNKTINELRRRVGMNALLTNGFVTANGLTMLEEIRRERRVEMAGEGLRYGDLLRTKTAEIELPQAIKGIKFHQDIYPEVVVGTDIQLDADGFIIAQGDDVRFFNPAKNYLFPLPSEQLRLNPNLVDNPNWSN